jgi:hypothetical protein
VSLETSSTSESSAADSRHYHWSAVILSSRDDAETLCSSIEAARAAASGERAIIDVMVNGNPRLAAQVTAGLESGRSSRSGLAAVRVWSLRLRDKANAWNQYVHTVWPGAEIAFFIDGYARVWPDALARLSDRLRESRRALAAAAVPTAGRSADSLRARMIKEPQINGSLYALRGATLDALRQSGARMPLGLYRQDGLLGSALAFGLDPARHAWTPDRIAVVPEASWSRRVASPWNTRDLLGRFDRMTRQALGVFEARAIREHLVHRERSLADLPTTNAGFIASWMRRHRAEALRTLCLHPLSLTVLAELCRRRDWSLGRCPPVLVTPHERSHEAVRRATADAAS